MPLLLTIGAFVPGLFGKKIADGTAKVLGIVTLVILAAGLIYLGKLAYDASLIEQHETEVRAEQAERDLRAERKADLEAANTQAELVETQRKLDEAAAKAKADRPEEARKEVGPVTQSYYDTLRKEKR